GARLRSRRARPTRLPAQRLRGLSHDPWYDRRRNVGTRPHPRGLEEHDRGRDGREHAREPAQVGGEPRPVEAGRRDAAVRALARRLRVGRRVPRDTEVRRVPIVATTVEPAGPGPAVPVDALEREELLEPFKDKPGIPGFLTTVDHKRIGMRYIYTSFAFFFVAGILALVMRVQLAGPDRDVVGPQLYNELFTVHGTTMIFLFNTPVLAGFGNYLVPLMIGTRDMAFPRLNAFSYWVFLFSGIFFYAGFVAGRPPDGGWFAYTP